MRSSARSMTSKVANSARSGPQRLGAGRRRSSAGAARRSPARRRSARSTSGRCRCRPCTWRSTASMFFALMSRGRWRWTARVDRLDDRLPHFVPVLAGVARAARQQERGGGRSRRRRVSKRTRVATSRRATVQRRAPVVWCVRRCGEMRRGATRRRLRPTVNDRRPSYGWTPRRTRRRDRVGRRSSCGTAARRRCRAAGDPAGAACVQNGAN